MHHIKTMITSKLLRSINTKIIKMNMLTLFTCNTFATSSQSVITISLIFVLINPMLNIDEKSEFCLIR